MNKETIRRNAKSGLESQHSSGLRSISSIERPNGSLSVTVRYDLDVESLGITGTRA